MDNTFIVLMLTIMMIQHNTYHLYLIIIKNKLKFVFTNLLFRDINLYFIEKKKDKSLIPRTDK